MSGASNKKEAIRRAEQSMRDRSKSKSKTVKSNKSTRQPSLGIGLRENAPVAQYTQRVTQFSTSKSNRKNADLMCRGQDFIKNISIPPNTNSGVTVENILINPLVGAFESTRLKKFGQLYEKFCFTKLRFHIQSNNPTSMAGSYVLAYDRDMADITPPSSTDGIKQFYGMEGTRSAAFWQDLTIDCPLIDTQDFYYTNYTGVDGRLTTQGQVYVAVQASAGASAPALSLWVEYEIHFMIPQLEFEGPNLKVQRNPDSTKQYPLWDDQGSTAGTSIRPMLYDLLRGYLAFGSANVNGRTSKNLTVVPRTIKNLPSLPQLSNLAETIGYQLNLPQGFYEVIANWIQNIPNPASGSASSESQFMAFTDNYASGTSSNLNPYFKADSRMVPTKVPGTSGLSGNVGAFIDPTNGVTGVAGAFTGTGGLPSGSFGIPGFTRFLVNIKDLMTPLAFIMDGVTSSTIKQNTDMSFRDFNIYVNEIDQTAFDLF